MTDWEENEKYLNCKDGNSDHIFSGYASPPQLWEQFCSYFRFIQFCHWTAEILKTSKKYWKCKTKCIYTKFAHFCDSMKN